MITDKIVDTVKQEIIDAKSYEDIEAVFHRIWPELIKVPDAAVSADLVSLAMEAVAGKEGNKHFVDYRPVTQKEAKDIHDKTDIDVTGFVHVLDEASVRHMIRRHGNPETEAKRGQIAVTVEDMALLPLIVSQYDSVEKGNDEPGKLPTIVYKKRIGACYYFVEEIRSGRRKLAAKTIRKTQPAPSATP